MKGGKAIIYVSTFVLFFDHCYGGIVKPKPDLGEIYSVKTDNKGICKWNGYIPGGAAIEIKPIIAPTANAENDMLIYVASLSQKASLGAITLDGAAFDAASKVFKKAPELVKALSVFGFVFGEIIDFKSPTPSDILAAANKAIAQLTEEVNERFVSMKEYVDREILNVEKDRINVEYKHMFKLFSDCIYKVTRDRIIECQEDASHYIRSGFEQFMPFFNKMKNYNNWSPPSVRDIKRMELTFLGFRDYATLDLIQAQVLANTFKEFKDSIDSGNLIYQRYLKELSEDAGKFIKYARDMFRWIYSTHSWDARELCEATKKEFSRCTKESAWFSDTYCTTYRSCRLDPTLPEKDACTKKVHVRADSKRPWTQIKVVVPGGRNPVAAGRILTQKRLEKAIPLYHDQQEKDVRNYWQSEVLSLIPTWYEVKKNADKALRELKMKDNENRDGYDHLLREYDERSKYPKSNKVDYEDFNYNRANDFSSRDPVDSVHAERYDIMEDRMMRRKDNHLSPRFQKRYMNAFETMRHHNDMARLN